MARQLTITRGANDSGGTCALHVTGALATGGLSMIAPVTTGALVTGGLGSTTTTMGACCASAGLAIVAREAMRRRRRPMRSSVSR